MASNIVPLVGRWTEIDGGHEFLKPNNSDDFGISLTGEKMTRGKLCVSVTLTDVGDSAGIVIGYDPELKSGLIATIGGWFSAYSLGSFSIGHIGTSASALAMVGHQSSLRQGVKYDLQVKVEGVLVSLKVDGATVFQHRIDRPLVCPTVGLYGYGKNGAIKFEEFQIKPKRRRAFVVIPFREPFESLFADLIKPVARSCGFKARRSKDIEKPGVVIDQMIEGLETYDVVIADVGTLTPNDSMHYFNPNVYFEVGYAFRAGTPLILLADKRVFEGKGLPFDIHHFSCIPYEDTIAGKNVIEKSLRKYLKSLKKTSR